MSPNPKEEGANALFCIFSREFVNETLNPRTKPTLSFLTEGQTFCRVFCVCVHINIIKE